MRPFKKALWVESPFGVGNGVFCRQKRLMDMVAVVLLVTMPSPILADYT